MSRNANPGPGKGGKASTRQLKNAKTSTGDQEEARKLARQTAKTAAKHSRDRENAEDILLVSKPRGDFFGQSSKNDQDVQKKKEAKPTPSRKPPTPEEVKRNLFHSGSTGEEGKDTSDLSDDGESSESSHSDHDNHESPGCARCTALSNTVCPQVRRFVKSLMNFADGQVDRDYENEATDKVDYLQPIPPGVKQVEISRGSGLYLSKPAKVKMVVECHKDPYKMARMLLVNLFGSQIKTEGVSAMGKGKASGIEESYLLAMYEFIKKNANIDNPPGTTKRGEPRKAFTYPVFIKELNRKMGSSRRDRKPKISPKKGSKKGPKKSPKKSISQTSPMKEAVGGKKQTFSNKWIVTPTKEQSSSDTPNKRQVTPTKERSSSDSGGLSTGIFRPFAVQAAAAQGGDRAFPPHPYPYFSHDLYFNSNNPRHPFPPRFPSAPHPMLSHAPYQNEGPPASYAGAGEWSRDFSNMKPSGENEDRYTLLPL